MTAIALCSPIAVYLLVALVGYGTVRRAFSDLGPVPFWRGYFRFITVRYYRNGRWLWKCR